MKHRLLIVGAALLGLALGVAPVLRYRYGAPHPTGHMDHGARHGGVLGMVGDHHIEVARDAGRVHVYVSDAYRRPVEPRGGRLQFEGGGDVPLTPDGVRLSAPDDPRFDTVTCAIELAGGAVLEMTAMLGAS